MQCRFGKLPRGGGHFKFFVVARVLVEWRVRSRRSFQPLETKGGCLSRLFVLAEVGNLQIPALASTANMSDKSVPNDGQAQQSPLVIYRCGLARAKRCQRTASFTRNTRSILLGPPEGDHDEHNSDAG